MSWNSLSLSDWMLMDSHQRSLKYYQLDPGQLVKEGTDPIWKRVADKTDNHQHVEGTHPQVSFVHLVVAGYGPKVSHPTLSC